MIAIFIYHLLYCIFCTRLIKSQLYNESNSTRIQSSHALSNFTANKVNNESEFRVLVSTTEKYFPIFLNWLLFYRRCGLDYSKLYIICFDKSTEVLLPQHGLECNYVSYLPTRSHAQTIVALWQIRLQIVLSLLEKNTDVLMSDVDAIWLRNPIPEVYSLRNDADIISSRAQFPEEIARELGATLCMGFMYIKSSEATVALWREIYSYTMKQKSFDDQRELNTYLMIKGLRYSNPPKVLINSILSTTDKQSSMRNRLPTVKDEEEFNRGELSIQLTKTVYSSNKTMNIATLAAPLPKVTIVIILLPHAKYRRVCYPTTNVSSNNRYK